MNTIKDQWEQLIGDSAARLSVDELERRRVLFYMGHASMLALIQRAAKLPNAERRALYQDWNREVALFNETLKDMVADPSFGTTKKEETPDDGK